MDKRALPLFKEVKTLDSTHPSVDRLIDASEAAILQGRDRTPREILGLSLALFVALAASVGLLAAGVLVAVPVRRRHRLVRRRAVPATSAVQPAPIPPSFPGSPRPAALGTSAPAEQGGRWTHQPLAPIDPAAHRGMAVTGDGSSAATGGQPVTPSPPWWPPEEQTAEPSAPLGTDLPPQSHLDGAPPPRHWGRHERRTGRRAGSDMTQPTEPAHNPARLLDGDTREHSQLDHAPSRLVCWNCGHQSPPTLRFCEECWSDLGRSGERPAAP